MPAQADADPDICDLLANDVAVRPLAEMRTRPSVAFSGKHVDASLKRAIRVKYSFRARMK